MGRIALECLDQRGEQGLPIEVSPGQGFLQPDHIIADPASKVPMVGSELADVTTDAQTGDVAGEDIEVLHHQLEQQRVRFGKYSRRR